MHQFDTNQQTKKSTWHFDQALSDAGCLTMLAPQRFHAGLVVSSPQQKVLERLRPAHYAFSQSAEAVDPRRYTPNAEAATHVVREVAAISPD
mmetsp:Transcript_57621/g.108614  ORF Transcript_57621/g.108614 Transcript_57621/m.108614 type:complete len:92 (+) Transcript_57621:20-295(+)